MEKKLKVEIKVTDEKEKEFLMIFIGIYEELHNKDWSRKVRDSLDEIIEVNEF